MIRFVVRKVRAARQNRDVQEEAGTAPNLENSVDAHKLDNQRVESDTEGTVKGAGAPVIQQAEGTPKQPALSSWQIWKPRVLLLVAVFLPVFLETLDYTGTHLLHT